MKTGQDCLNLAQTKIGQKYVFGVDVPTNNPNWDGPWDCAEFVTWVVYQVSGKLYGCVDNHNPANCDAYTGAWARRTPPTRPARRSYPEYRPSPTPHIRRRR